MKRLFSLLCLPVFISCTNVLGVSTVISPRNIDREGLKNLPEVITPEYALRVAVIPSLSDKKAKIVISVDNKFSEFRRCMDITGNGELARQYLISVVDGTFKCKYHGGRCNGEYDRNNHMIIVTYKAFNREGILPLLKHEWAHLYGFLKPDDSNLEYVRQCTEY